MTVIHGRWVANSLDFNKNYEASVFETTIRFHLIYLFNNKFLFFLLGQRSSLGWLRGRSVWHVHCFLSFLYTYVECRVLGGLLSAYDLSGDKVFLEKAQDIADRLLPAWNTPSGIPYNRINLAYGNANNPGWTGVSSEYFLFFLLTDLFLFNSIRSSRTITCWFTLTFFLRLVQRGIVICWHNLKDYMDLLPIWHSYQFKTWLKKCIQSQF